MMESWLEVLLKTQSEILLAVSLALGTEHHSITRTELLY
jgi:hypothetical protein